MRNDRISDHVLGMRRSPVYDVNELVKDEAMREEARIGLTSDSAFLMMSMGGSGLPPGVRGMRSAARTSFFGGGSRQQVMKRTALIRVLAAV